MIAQYKVFESFQLGAVDPVRWVAATSKEVALEGIAKQGWDGCEELSLRNIPQNESDLLDFGCDLVLT